VNCEHCDDFGDAPRQGTQHLIYAFWGVTYSYPEFPGKIRSFHFSVCLCDRHMQYLLEDGFGLSAYEAQRQCECDVVMLLDSPVFPHHASHLPKIVWEEKLDGKDVPKQPPLPKEES